jgi:hypothetical protein
MSREDLIRGRWVEPVSSLLAGPAVRPSGCIGAELAARLIVGQLENERKGEP